MQSLEINLLEVLSIAVLSMMFANWYQPIQPLKMKFIDLFQKWEKFYMNLMIALTCPKCVGFMLGLVYFLDLRIAALVALFSYLINHIKDRVEDWYE